MTKLSPERVQQLFDLSRPGVVGAPAFAHPHPREQRGITIGADELAELLRVYDDAPVEEADAIGSMVAFGSAFAGAFIGASAHAPGGLLEQLRGKPRPVEPPAPAPKPVKQKTKRRRANR